MQMRLSFTTGISHGECVVTIGFVIMLEAKKFGTGSSTLKIALYFPMMKPLNHGLRCRENPVGLGFMPCARIFGAAQIFREALTKKRACHGSHSIRYRGIVRCDWRGSHLPPPQHISISHIQEGALPSIDRLQCLISRLGMVTRRRWSCFMCSTARWSDSGFARIHNRKLEAASVGA